MLVVDANTAQTLQVLERHKANVVKVRYTWFKVYHLSLVYIYRRVCLIALNNRNCIACMFA